MQRLSIEAFHVCIRAQAAVRAIHIAHEFRLGKFTFVGQARVRPFPVSPGYLQQ